MYFSKKAISLVLVLAFVMVLCSGCVIGKRPSGENEDTNEVDTESMARWEGDTFISSWAGFKVSLPEGWMKLTDEEIKQVIDMGSDAVAGSSGEKVQEYIDANVIYPMYISENPENMVEVDFASSIIVVYEKMVALNNVLVKDGETYLKSMKSQLEQTDMGYEFGEIEKVQFAGSEYHKIVAELGELNLKQIYYSKKVDSYIVSFIITVPANRAEVEATINSSIEKY